MSNTILFQIVSKLFRVLKTFVALCNKVHVNLKVNRTQRLSLLLIPLRYVPNVHDVYGELNKSGYLSPPKISAFSP